ncbi:MAG: hypothetical protein U5J95_01620 [Balneolaceae bacterium]|nr:hypothetical protein [Balneolaceae bacterium]
MNWLKDILVDIAVTVFIITAVLLSDPWMKWVIWVYTGIMLLTKAMVLLGDNLLMIVKKAKNEVPSWIPHLLYGINTALLLYFQWWYAAGGWALIWIFSFIADQKIKSRRGEK